jgi:hypothetical protein
MTSRTGPTYGASLKQHTAEGLRVATKTGHNSSSICTVVLDQLHSGTLPCLVKNVADEKCCSGYATTFGKAALCNIRVEIEEVR